MNSSTTDILKRFINSLPDDWSVIETNKEFSGAALTGTPKPGIYKTKYGFTILVRSWEKDQDRPHNPPKEKLGHGIWLGPVDTSTGIHFTTCFKRWEAWIWYAESPSADSHKAK